MNTSIERIDFLDTLAELPQMPQRQDSTATQLRDLVAVANRLGMYDAADIVARLADAARGGK